jgi:hypothetical protein
MLDEMARIWITAYFWPYFIMGNMDNFKEIGITLNGIHPLCKPRK